MVRLLTPSGNLVSPRERAWSMAGINTEKVSPSTPLLKLVSGPGGAPNYATLAAIYRSNPWVFAAVTALSRGLGRLPLYVYQYDGDGTRKRIRGDIPLGAGRPGAGQQLDLLLRMPEPRNARSTWIQKMCVDWFVQGNAVATMDRQHGGIPSALWHTSYRRVDVVTGEQVPVLYYKVNGDNGSKIFAPEDVLHIGMGSDPDTAVGLSPLQPLRATIALHDALSRHLNAYFENAMRPSGVLEVKPGTNEKAILAIQEQVRALYASPEQAGKILVTSAQFKGMSNDPASSNIVELIKLSREEIAGAYQVPPPILGILDRAIQSNVDGLRSQWIRDVLGAWSVLFEGALNAQLSYSIPSLSQNGIFIGFDLDEAIRPDLAAMADVLVKLRHVFTPHEMREMMDKGPLVNPAITPYAETVWMPSGEIPLGLDSPSDHGKPLQPLNPDGTQDNPAKDLADSQQEALDAGKPAPEAPKGAGKF